MPIEETKHDLVMKRINLIIAILGGIAALAVGVYNVKKSYFEKPVEVVAPPPPQQQQPDKLRSALEDVGASWLETLKKKQEQP